MDATTNSLNWFEIPVTDFDRAKHFYQVVFSIHMEDSSMPGMQMAFFPYQMENGKVAGAIAKSPYHIPAADGVIVYLNSNPDLNNALEKVAAEGGEVLMGKTLISPEIGYMAYFKDTEGNRIGLHSQH